MALNMLHVFVFFEWMKWRVQAYGFTMKFSRDFSLQLICVSTEMTAKRHKQTRKKILYSIFVEKWCITIILQMGLNSLIYSWYDDWLPDQHFFNEKFPKNQRIPHKYVTVMGVYTRIDVCKFRCIEWSSKQIAYIQCEQCECEWKASWQSSKGEPTDLNQQPTQIANCILFCLREQIKN